MAWSPNALSDPPSVPPWVWWRLLTLVSKEESWQRWGVLPFTTGENHVSVDMGAGKPFRQGITHVALTF
jgi:hypothetical protein